MLACVGVGVGGVGAGAGVGARCCCGIGGVIGFDICGIDIVRSGKC